MKPKGNSPKFKPYHQNQTMLFPPSVEDFIADNHPVRVVNNIVDKLDIDSLLAQYSHKGTSAYNPRMMLKLLVYAYLSNIYSSRKIEAASTENVHFMWLSGMQKPDHNTIARFRSGRLKGVIKEVFSQVVLMLSETGHVDLKNVYTDGTKIEANANKFTFVWGTRINTRKEEMKKRLKELWAYTEKVAREDLRNVEKPDFDDLDPDKVEQVIETINNALKKKKNLDKKKRQQVYSAKRTYKANLEKYREDERIMGEKRNSYSKTDHDATFMRMKEDRLSPNIVKPGYNLQFSTNNQYILHYSLHQNPGDTKTLIPHLDGFHHYLKTYPENLCADAGYGSEENYVYLKEREVTPFVKYNYFHMEQKKKFSEYHQSQLQYDVNNDHFICPSGQIMRKTEEKEELLETGHITRRTHYQAENCSGCALREECHKSKGDRVIVVNHPLNELKKEARDLLLSDEGKSHRSQRPVDVEASFGNLKQNKHFKRFMLRGIEKAEVEMGLLALSINLKKMSDKAA